ncbi:hypothetical protein LOC67_24720 [Stieleria sp. JC731]|uniref:hypothetical protein n=1 Tax=Stieleria sp. JC731 TaxID=2894195 RepID=UPI001E42EDC9|nr:hypothetical protein [Stieleria sp. JC731]MCC9603767.1 hypothetical protein [Stieleria sp. JC731]
MSEAHQRKLPDRLEQMPMSDAPSPWSVIGGSLVGGLTDIGFVPNTDDLLVVSSQGRGLFDTISGEKLARDSEEFFDNPDETGMTAPGIGRANGVPVPLAGLHGGGLLRITRDGWSITIAQLPWPRHVIFLSSKYAAPYDDSGNSWKICDDGACEYRMAGFSPSGCAFVFASSCELVIYGRDAG